MDAVGGSASPARFDEQALKRGVTSVKHPLTQALLALTFTTGLVDAVSYLALGRVFTANMTGNVVLLGFGLAGSGGLPVVAPIVSLASVLVGAAAGGALVVRMSDRHPALVARALGIEAFLLAVCAIVAGATSIHPGNASAYVLIVLMAFAMGVRNATARRLAVPDLTTTVLTMTLTGIAADTSAIGGPGSAIVRRALSILAMAVGALIGALLVLRVNDFAPLALAAGLAMATLLVYVPRAMRLGR